MKRAIDQSDLKQALKCSSEMLRELRTSLMTPKNYYELFMKVFDELRWLENYFAEVHRNGKPMVELYEMVQSCGNVLPRLYLLITVGSVYIQSREAPAKDILKGTKGEAAPAEPLPVRALRALPALRRGSRVRRPAVAGVAATECIASSVRHRS